MPTISLTRLAVIAGKVTLIVVIFTFFISGMEDFETFILTLIGSMTTYPTGLNGLDLGYVAGAIGFVDFLNLLVAMIYSAVSFYFSGMITIILFKYTTKLYSFVMSI